MQRQQQRLRLRWWMLPCVHVPCRSVRIRAPAGAASDWVCCCCWPCWWAWTGTNVIRKRHPWSRRRLCRLSNLHQHHRQSRPLRHRLLMHHHRVKQCLPPILVSGRRDPNRCRIDCTNAAVPSFGMRTATAMVICHRRKWRVVSRSLRTNSIASTATGTGAFPRKSSPICGACSRRGGGRCRAEFVQGKLPSERTLQSVRGVTPDTGHSSRRTGHRPPLSWHICRRSPWDPGDRGRSNWRGCLPRK